MALAGLLAAGCGDPQAPPPARPGVVLVLDGIEVREADLQDLLGYLDTTGERLGRGYKVQTILDRHVLPLALAKRAFAAERRVQRERAEAMQRSVQASGNAYPQLRSKGELLGGEATPGHLSRQHMELAQAAWCFDPDNLGWVSPVIEVPQGFCLLAVQDHQPGPTRTADAVDAYLVPFYTHGRAEFDAWYGRQKELLAGRLEYVHPEYADALPRWIAR